MGATAAFGPRARFFENSAASAPPPAVPNPATTRTPAFGPSALFFGYSPAAPQPTVAPAGFGAGGFGSANSNNAPPPMSTALPPSGHATGGGFDSGARLGTNGGGSSTSANATNGFFSQAPAPTPVAFHAAPTAFFSAPNANPMPAPAPSAYTTGNGSTSAPPPVASTGFPSNTNPFNAPALADFASGGNTTGSAFFPTPAPANFASGGSFGFAGGSNGGLNGGATNGGKRQKTNVKTAPTTFPPAPAFGNPDLAAGAAAFAATIHGSDGPPPSLADIHIPPPHRRNKGKHDKSNTFGWVPFHKK